MRKQAGFWTRHAKECNCRCAGAGRGSPGACFFGASQLSARPRTMARGDNNISCIGNVHRIWPNPRPGPTTGKFGKTRQPNSANIGPTLTHHRPDFIDTWLQVLTPTESGLAWSKFHALMR